MSVSLSHYVFVFGASAAIAGAARVNKSPATTAVLRIFDIVLPPGLSAVVQVTLRSAFCGRMSTALRIGKKVGCGV